MAGQDLWVQDRDKVGEDLVLVERAALVERVAAVGGGGPVAGPQLPAGADRGERGQSRGSTAATSAVVANGPSASQMRASPSSASTRSSDCAWVPVPGIPAPSQVAPASRKRMPAVDSAAGTFQVPW